MDKLEQSYVATVPQRWKSKAQADNHLQCQLMVSTFRTWDLSSRTSIKKKKRRKKHKPLQKLKFLSLRFHSLHLQKWKFSSLPATAALLFLKATLYGSLPWWSCRVGSAPWANRRDRTPMWPSWRNVGFGHLRLYAGLFVNCSAQISVLKRKTLFNQRGSFVHQEFHGTETLIGCPSFFHFGTENWADQSKNHPVDDLWSKKKKTMMIVWSPVLHSSLDNLVSS